MTEPSPVRDDGRNDDGGRPLLGGTARRGSSGCSQAGGLQPHPVVQPSVPRIGVLPMQTPFVAVP
jgi:hypothetical protein